MEVKPGYKQTEVGVIPEDWEDAPLGELAEIRMCKRIFSEQTDPSGDIPFFKIGTFGGVPDAFISGGLYREYRRKYPFPQKGDVLLSAAGTLGRTVVYDGEDAYFQDSNIVWLDVGRGKVVNEYLYQCYQKIGWASPEGSTISRLYNGIIRKTKIPLPPTESEQRAIATALSDMDALLDGLDRLIAKKLAIKQATMQQLLTGQTRLPGFSGEWEVKRLGDHLTFLKNGVNSRAELFYGGDVRYLHYGDIHGSSQVVLNPASVDMPCLPRTKASRLDRLQDGDLIYADASEDIDGIGKSVEIRNVMGIELVSGLHTIAIRFNKSVLVDGFKAYIQFIPEFRTHLQQLAAGTKVYATNRAHISSAELRLPGIDEQQAISALIIDMDAEITALETHRTKTRVLKQAMMQELLTGRTRLI